MTTMRLTPTQKRKIREAARLLSHHAGRHVSQGEAAAEAADFALKHRHEWLEAPAPHEVLLRDDPLFDRRIKFPMGKTDSSRLDELTYGRT